MGVYEELTGSLREPFYCSPYSNPSSKRCAIKAQLYVLGWKLGFRPVLDARVYVDFRDDQIDCLFLDVAPRVPRIVCGFEVSATAQQKSLDRLLTLWEDAEKIIISFGQDAAWRKMESRRKSFLRPDIEDIKLFRMSSLRRP